LGSPATERPYGVIGGTPEGLAYFKKISVNSLANRLTSKNKVLVICAGADEQVPMQQCFALYQAFQDAGFVYDELTIPGAGHSGGRGPYGVMRTLRYFAENLGGPR
jgi:dipeptidyl-peptidase-4